VLSLVDFSSSINLTLRNVLIECKLEGNSTCICFSIFNLKKKENQIRDQKEHLFERKVTLQLVISHPRANQTRSQINFDHITFCINKRELM
jgi:hypothetical protein